MRSLDALSVQMDFIVAECRHSETRKLAELTETLTPVTKQAMQMATDELENPDISTEELKCRVGTLASSLQIQALMAQLGPMSELAETLTHLSGPAMAKVTDMLTTADEKGYFAFARGAARSPTGWSPSSAKRTYRRSATTS